MQRINRAVLQSLSSKSFSQRLSSNFSTSSLKQNSQIQSSQDQPLPPAPPTPQKWDLFAGVVLERRPLITPEATPIEAEYSTHLTTWEVELSRKSSHEIRKEKESVILEKIKSGELDPDKAPPITAQDEEDLWSAELSQFKFASRTTDGDKGKDSRSLNRALDSHLLLLIEQKLGRDYKWMCPQGLRQDGETMRQTAERLLSQVCPQVKAKVLGNAPWGFYKYKYPNRSVTEQNLSAVGAKVFFFKAQVLSGEIKPIKSSGKEEKKSNTNITDFKDFAWCTREELISKLQPEYHKQIREFLVDEGN